MTPEDTTSLLELLDAHRKTLTIGLEQRALFGLAHVPPGVVIDILNAREEIRRIKSLLLSSGVAISDSPNEEEPAPARASQSMAISDLLWPDGSILVLLPVRLDNGNALCISKHPVTNKQYRLFAENTNSPAPLGQHHRGGKWVGPFSPWDDPNFSEDSQPVVCIPYYSAFEYCAWVNKLVGQHNRAVATKQESSPGYRLPKSSTRLLAPAEWEFAAYGTSNPTYSGT